MSYRRYRRSYGRNNGAGLLFIFFVVVYVAYKIASLIDYLLKEKPYILYIGATVLVFIIGLVLYFVIRNKRRPEEIQTYGEDAGDLEFSVVSTPGEKEMYDALKMFEPWGARFVMNCLLKKDSGDTTEIDMVMVTRKGIFVFENKDYTGWVFGSEDDQMWTATYRGGFKGIKRHKFYNPVKQNEGHIKALKDKYGDGIPFYSLVVFSDECRLKKVPANGKARIIHASDIVDVITTIMRAASDVQIPEERINEVYTSLFANRCMSKDQMEQHIEKIRRHSERRN